MNRGMGIVSDEAFARELERADSTSELILPEPSYAPIIEGEVVEMARRGRRVGDVNVPSSLRKLIGDVSVTEGREAALALANDFGVSPSSVSAYGHGANSTATYDQRPNLPHINRAKERLGRRARNTLRRALAHITDEKLKHTDAKDLAGVARAMSKVSKDMEPETPKDGNGGTSQPVFQVYSPTIVQENHFETITARE